MSEYLNPDQERKLTPEEADALVWRTANTALEISANLKLAYRAEISDYLGQLFDKSKSVDEDGLVSLTSLTDIFETLPSDLPQGNLFAAALLDSTLLTQL